MLPGIVKVENLDVYQLNVGQQPDLRDLRLRDLRLRDLRLRDLRVLRGNPMADNSRVARRDAVKCRFQVDASLFCHVRHERFKECNG